MGSNRTRRLVRLGNCALCQLSTARLPYRARECVPASVAARTVVRSPRRRSRRQRRPRRERNRPLRRCRHSRGTRRRRTARLGALLLPKRRTTTTKMTTTTTTMTTTTTTTKLRPRTTTMTTGCGAYKPGARGHHPSRPFPPSLNSNRLLGVP